MASNDDKDATRPGRPGEAPSGPKRPTPTIELEAQEVEVRPQGADAEPGEQSADADAAEPAAEGETPEGEREPDPNAAPDEPQRDGAEESVGAPPPRPRTRPRELRGFLTHLAAGLAGGVIGVLAAGYGLGHLPLGALLPEPTEDPRMEQLVDRLGALDARIAAVEPMARQAPQAMERIELLEQTMAALEEAAREGDGIADAAALSAALTRLGERVDREMEGLRQELGQVGARSAAERESLLAALARLEQDLSGLRQSVEARATEPVVDADAAARLDELSTRMAALEQALEEAARPAASEQARAGALALAFAGLRRAADAGEPFAAELATVEALAPPDADLAALKAHAVRGVPTAGALARALPEFARKAEVARDDPPPASPSLMDRLLASARSVVTVRRTATGEGAAADVTVRMQALAEAGDLAGAVAEGESLSGPARAALDPWLAESRGRLHVDASLAALESQFLTALGVTDGEEEQK